MRKNLFLSMLDTTKDMYILAQEDHWDTLAEREKERQALIKQITSSLDDEEKDNQQIIIEIIKEINQLNKKINQLAESRNNEQRLSLVQFKKGQKAKDFYLEK